MGSLGALFSRLDEDPRLRGAQFERVCQWLLTNAPIYRHELAEVWLWREWPGRWSDLDAGIDLVARSRTGELWAIQAKAYDPAYSVTKRDIDSFLSESSRPEFSYRLLIATTDRIGATAVRTMHAQEKNVGLLLRGDLASLDVDWPVDPASIEDRPQPARTPRPHQLEAIKDVVAGFDTSDRGQLIMACGTGKTLTSLFIAERMESRRTLVLVPSLSLMSQTINAWTANATSDFEFLPVCSDETVTGSDAALQSTSGLGFPVTTYPSEIASFLRRKSRPLVVFATYQSSPQVTRAFAVGRLPRFDLVIADEAHRCTGPISSEFATVLDPAMIPARKRLFMTATPRYFTGHLVRTASESDFEVASMDDASLFGPVLHRLGFASAIERGLLTDYRVVVIGVSDIELLDWTESGRLVTDGKQMVTDARTLASQIGLLKAIDRFELHRVVSFHSRVSRARQFADSLPDVANWMTDGDPSASLWSEHVSGKMSAGKRRALLDRLATLTGANGSRTDGSGFDSGLLANARCLAEGVDLPSIDGVAFIDPRRSEVDIVQAVGRAIRLSPDKTLGTIVIPVFISTEETDQSSDDGEIDATGVLESSAFQPVWDVVSALRAHDDALAAELDSMRRDLGRLESPEISIPNKIIFDVPTLVSQDFADAFSVCLVEQTTERWEFWFGLLERYVEGHGTSRVPQKGLFEGFKLGVWVNGLRSHSDRLTTDQRERLEQLPDWSWDPFGDAWERGFAAATAYADEHGHLDVSGDLIVDGSSPNGFALGRWVSKQRAAQSGGHLSPERGSRLEALPGWSWSALDHRWETGLAALVAFASREGHCRVPSGHLENGVNLSSWTSSQRQRFRNGLTGADQIQRLDAVPGWFWSPRTDRFELGIELLREFAAHEGHCRVPKRFAVTTRGTRFDLGGWVRSVRSMARAGQVGPGRLTRLEALPGWTLNPEDQAWDETYEMLSEFAANEGHARVPQSLTADGVALGSWVINQRMLNGKGKLSADRAARLEALPGWSWDPRADAFEEGFAALEKFVVEHGHARPTAAAAQDGFRVGGWVSEQRGNYHRGRFDPKRVERLEALKGWTWSAAVDKWEIPFALLEQFAAETGSALVPLDHVVDEFTLGVWARQQRSRYRKGRMNPEHIARLEAVPGWTWDTRDGKWERGFTALQEFVASNGHARVPSSFVVDGFKLGQWVSVQRVEHQRGTLSAGRSAQLEALPDWQWRAK